MLINYDSSKPLYLLGNGISSQEIFYFIDTEIDGEVLTIPLEDFEKLDDSSQCILSVQDINLRNEFIKKIKYFNRVWSSYIHPEAFVVNQKLVGQGVIIWPCTYIGYQVKIGNFSSIAQKCNVGHGAELGINVIMSPLVSVGGSTVIGNNVVFGLSCLIKDKISISDNTEFLMGSIVTKNIDTPGRYYGNRSA